MNTDIFGSLKKYIFLCKKKKTPGTQDVTPEKDKWEEPKVSERFLLLLIKIDGENIQWTINRCVEHVNQ